MPKTRQTASRWWGVVLSIFGVLCPGGLFAQVEEAASEPVQPPVVWVEVPLPPVMTADLKPPPEGDPSAARLRAPLIDVLTEIEPTDFGDAGQGQALEVLPQRAAHALDRAQRLMDEGRNFEAGESLREAERLAPDHPGVVRALGLAYVHSGTPARGLPHLRRAAAMDPADVGVRIVMTRLALDRRAWDETLALAAAIEQANSAAQEPDPSARVFADYARAVALEQAGYAAASAELYRAVLAAQPPGPGRTLAGREHYILHENESDLHRHVGDLALRLGDPAAALAAFEQVDPTHCTDPAGLAARRAFLFLRSGRADDALNTLADFLASPAATEQHAPLAAYLVEQGADPAVVDARLAETGGRAPRVTFALVAARAAVSPPQQTTQLIADWLAEQPPRLDVFGRAIALVDWTEDRLADPDTIAQVLHLTADAMGRQPAQSQGYAQSLLSLGLDPVALLRALRRPEIAGADRPMLLRLSAEGYTEAGRWLDAHGLLERALAIEPEHLATRRELVRLSTALGSTDPAYFDQAAELLGPVGITAPWDDFQAYTDLLRYRAFAMDKGQERDRMALLRQAQRGVATRVRAHPDDLDLLLLDARVRAEARGLADGIRAVESLINRFPEEERVYIAGIGLYGTIREGPERDNNLGRYFDFQDRLRPRLIEHLPQSRTARHEQALILTIDNDRPDLAVQELVALLDEDPEDLRALGGLRYALEQLGEQDRVAAIDLRLLELEPPGARRALGLMRYHLSHGEADQAAAIGEQTFIHELEGVLPGPPMTGDMASGLLAMMTTVEGVAQTEPLYLEMLRRLPDSPRLNNALGYMWALAGKELLAAEGMIQRAIDAGGEVSSYLDSMAWVLYKMGRFAEAEAYMRQAIVALVQELAEAGLEDDSEPAAKAVYFDHLGDILYRLGEAQAAATCWDVARMKEVPVDSPLLDEETATVLERSASKASAVRDGLEPAVSEVPGEPAFGDGIHPADRG